MEPHKHSPPSITDQFKGYVRTRLLLTKYQAIKKGTLIASEIMLVLIMGVSILLFFLFVGITLACLLTKILNSSWAGFCCVMMLYLLIGMLGLIFKKNIKVLVMSALTRKIVKNQ